MTSGVFAPLQVPLQFDDASCSFSEHEWRALDENQKDFYRHIMKQNYQAVVSVGKSGPASELGRR